MREQREPGHRGYRGVTGDVGEGGAINPVARNQHNAKKRYQSCGNALDRTARRLMLARAQRVRTDVVSSVEQ